MNQRHPDGSEGNGSAVPRDLPDQHARPGDDPLDVDIEGMDSSADDDADESGDSDDDLPDSPDEAGAGRRGNPNTGGVHPEQPVPDEPSG
ncbi:hypothetical protein ACFT9I_32810 [Streptomyces sp. NPDC057137]|uniref:hypothetical protein n=1 Tax=Streptomyces sp. NPDC057137 TaxID=3346030 RepID=UPI00363C580B